MIQFRVATFIRRLPRMVIQETHLYWLLVLAPGLAVVGALILGTIVSNKILGRHSTVTLEPVIIDPRGSQASQTRSFYFRTLWAASSGAVAVMCAVVMLVGIITIQSNMGWWWTGISLVLITVAWVAGYWIVFTPISNHIGICTQMYRVWPELERQKDVLTAFVTAGMMTLVLMVISTQYNLSNGVVEKEAISESRAQLRLALYLGAVAFVVGEVSVYIFHRLPTIMIDQRQEELLKRIAAGIAIQAGTGHSVALGTLFLSGFAALEFWSGSMKNALGGLSIADLFAILGPVASGFAAALSGHVGLPTFFEPNERTIKSNGLRPLTVLTLNAGLLEVKWGPWVVLRPSPFVGDRYSHLDKSLRTTNADVVCLQEIYKRRQKIGLAKSLAASFPYATWPPTDPGMYIDSGLMILSRYPIKETRFTRFRSAPLSERLFVKRGFLEAVVATPMGLVRVVTYHTTAGGLFGDPEAEITDRYRDRQIGQMIQATRRANEELLIFAGDLNAGPCPHEPYIGAKAGTFRSLISKLIQRFKRSRAPGDPSRYEPDFVSGENYRTLISGGFVDVYASCAADVPLEKSVTWDSRSDLNRSGPHKHQRPQRIDHIFIKSDGLGSGWKIRGARRIFEELTVKVPSGMTTVSDHYGVSVTFSRENIHPKIVRDET